MALSDQVSQPHTDHSGAVQQGTARPPKQEHRPNRPRPLTGGTTRGHRVKTQEKDIVNSNTHTTPTFPGRFPTTSQRSPFLNFLTVSSLFPPVSFTFQTNSLPTTDHFTTISDHFPDVSRPHTDHSRAVQHGRHRQHVPTHCRSDVIPASFQSARKRRWRRWRKSGTLLTPPGAGVNGTRISIILHSINHGPWRG